jgi:hypothetical protein
MFIEKKKKKYIYLFLQIIIKFLMILQKLIF